MLKKVSKIVLSTLPKAPFSPDGVCPKCSFPLEARMLGREIILLCKNWKCDYYVIVRSDNK